MGDGYFLRPTTAPKFAPNQDDDAERVAQSGYVLRALSPSAQKIVESTLRDKGEGAFITADDFMRRAANAATFNAADYVAAAINPNSTADQERQLTRQVRQDSPVAGALGDIAGTMLNPVNRFAASRLPFQNPVAKNAAEGAIYGASGGATTTDGTPTERATAAVLEGVLGAGAGAALPIAGATAKYIGEKAAPAFRGITERFGDPQKHFVNRFNEKLDESGMTPERLEARRKFLGPQATYADAAKGPLEDYAETLANTAGKQAAYGRRVMDMRQQGQARRVNQAVSEDVGNLQFQGTLDDLNKTKRASSAPIYNEAFETFPDLAGKSNSLAYWEKLSDDPTSQIGRSIRDGYKFGINAARREADLAQQPFDPTKWGVTKFNEAGEPIVERVPIRSLQQWDGVKRGIDAKINAARDPVTKEVQWTAELRDMDRFRQQLVGELDRVTSVGGKSIYKDARDSWGGPSQSEDAMWSGFEFMRMTPDQIAKRVSAMPEGEYDFYMMGAAERMRQAVSATQDMSDATKKLIGNGEMRDRIRALFKDPREYRRFLTKLQAEDMMFNSRARKFGNSATARRLSNAEDDATQVVSDIGQTMLTPGGPVEKGLGLARTALRYAKEPVKAVREEGAVIFSRDPLVQAEFMRQLKLAREAAAKNPSKNQELARLLLLARSASPSSGAAAGSVLSGINQ